MRVIAGKARGLKLFAPAGDLTRPTADRVREALFSIVASRMPIIGAQVLDLCAGTGALGIEALSRGAATCCFVENRRDALQSLNRNLAAARLQGQSRVLEMDVLKGLRLLAAEGGGYRIIFCDPPYASGLYRPVAEAVSEHALLDDDGLLVLESSSKMEPERYGRLTLADRRVYGDTALLLYSPEETE